MKSRPENDLLPSNTRPIRRTSLVLASNRISGMAATERKADHERPAKARATRQETRAQEEIESSQFSQKRDGQTLRRIWNK